MIRKCLGLVLLLILMTQLCGCWDYMDLEDQALPTIATFDTAENVSPAGEQYQQIVLGTMAPNKTKPTMEKGRVTVTPAPTIGMSREERAWEFTRVYNPTLIQTTLFSEKLARRGLEQAVDITLRSPKIKNSVPMCIVEGRASDLLNVNVERIVPNVGQYMLQMLSHPNRRGFMVYCTIHEFNVNSITPGKNPVVPTVKAIDDKIAINGTAIFDGMKMIGRIGKPETRTLILLRGIHSGGYIPYSLDHNGYMETGTVFVGNSRSVKVKRQGNKYTFDITIKLKGYIVETIGCGSKLEEKNAISSIEQTVAHYIEKDCQKFLDKMQYQFELDCIDISKYAMARWRNELEGTDEGDFIKNADIKVKVEVKLTNFGERT